MCFLIIIFVYINQNIFYYKQLKHVKSFVSFVIWYIEYLIIFISNNILYIEYLIILFCMYCM